MTDGICQLPFFPNFESGVYVVGKEPSKLLQTQAVDSRQVPSVFVEVLGGFGNLASQIRLLCAFSSASTWHALSFGDCSQH